MRLPHSVYKKHFLITLLLCIVLSATAQQRFSFTQYMENLTPVNPAWSLLNKDGGTIYSTVRKQWSGVDGAPTNYLFNVNLPIKSVNGSAGFVVMDDQLAVEHKTEFSAFFAKSINLTETQKLAVSLSGGMYRYTTQYAKLDPNDPAIQRDVNENKPNVGIGVLFYSDKYYLGLSIPQLTIRELGNGSLLENNNFRNNYYFAGGWTADLDEDFTYKPSLLASYARGVPVIADISNMFYLKDTFGLGANYRTNNELAAVMSINTDSFHIGYSYQFGASTLNIGGFKYATHEFSLALRFGMAHRVPIPGK